MELADRLEQADNKFIRNILQSGLPQNFRQQLERRQIGILQDIPIPETHDEIKTPFERFVQKRELTNLPLQEQREIHDNYKTIMRALDRNKLVEYTIENET